MFYRGFWIIETNGNFITHLMHLLVFHELQRMRVNRELDIEKIMPEKPIVLEHSPFPRKGSFDFLVNAGRKNIGIEVLTRPSRKKLLEKLRYAKNVDEFVFAIPKDAFELYKKSCHKGHEHARQNFFGKEFKSPKIKVWLLDLRDLRVLVKSSFGKIFNVKEYN